jgi:ATP-dependent Clp protease ATP-binding subunit ClpC
MADGEILQRFTPPAIRVVQYAKEEARRSRRNEVGTEQILLGLIREQEGVAARVLERVGVSPGRVQDEIKRQMGKGEKPARKQPSRAWSAEARRVLEIAVDEARELNPKLGLPNFVDTEHLLLGLLREPETMGVRILVALGVDVAQVRQETMEMLGASAESADVPPEQVRAQAHPADGEILQRFTPPAIRVVQYAKEEARRFRGNTVGSEHVLLGLIREQEGVAARVLERLGVSLGRAQNEIRRQMDMAENRAAGMPVSRTWSQGARRALEHALDEARELNPKLGLPNFVDTEHLLLGLVRDTDSRAVRVLVTLGVDIEQVRREIVKLLGGAPSAAAAPPAARAYVQTPVLDAFGRDLTRLAREEKLDPVVGRVREMQHVIRLLGRRARNRPLLIGERGVGKTAIVEGLAQRAVRGEAPEFLQERRLLALDTTRLVIGIRREIVAEIRKAGHELVLFLDRMEALGAAGAEEDVIGLSALLSVIADQSGMYCLGATTPAHYREGVERNPALAGFFQPVVVNEPSADETVAMLKGLRPRYESHHRVKIDDDALLAAVQLSARLLRDRFLPEKAIDIIDEAASRIRPDLSDVPEEVVRLRQELDRVQRELRQVVSVSPLERDEADYHRGVELRERRHHLREELDARETAWREDLASRRTQVTAEDVAQVVSSWTGKPVSEAKPGEEEGA